MKSKIVKLCLEDYLFKTYHFLVEVNVEESAINAFENESNQDNITKKTLYLTLHIVRHFGERM